MIKRTVSWAAKIALTGGSLWYLQSKVDIGAAWETGRHISPWLFAAAWLLQLVQVAICAGRWQLVLKAIGAWLPFGKACELFCIGNFFGQVLPGAVGGDAVRVWKARRSGLSLMSAINSVMLERAATVFGLVLLVTATQPLLADRLHGVSGLWLFPVLTLGAAAGLAFLMVLDRLPRAISHWRIVRGFARLAGDTRLLFLAPGNVIPTMGVVVLGHINLALVVWVLAIGLDAPVGLLDCLVLVPPVILVATLPISIAGWGAREVAMITLFGLIGVPATQATAISVLFGVVTLLVALPGGFLWMVSKDRQAMSSQIMPEDLEA